MANFRNGSICEILEIRIYGHNGRSTAGMAPMVAISAAAIILERYTTSATILPTLIRHPMSNDFVDVRTARRARLLCCRR